MCRFYLYLLVSRGASRERGVRSSVDALWLTLRATMEIKRGIPVSPGVAIGPALVLDTEGFRIPRASSTSQTGRPRSTGCARASAAAAARCPHAAGSDQPKARQAIRRHLRRPRPAHRRPRAASARSRRSSASKTHSAEYAVSRVMRRHAKALESLNQSDVQHAPRPTCSTSRNRSCAICSASKRRGCSSISRSRSSSWPTI